MQYALQYAASQAPPVLGAGTRQGEAHPFIPRNAAVSRTLEQCQLRDYVVPEFRELRALEARFPPVQANQISQQINVS